ncbi:MAG: FAD-dependent pyridine nucleotide-disulfide oxidoreductase [Frankiales bacterium]|nr:FAD-dependent pyridine nucleotide-disulfide oxidoreductase [Frankiales bacterium]
MTKRVVIIGSGFGGLFAAKALRRADVDITLIAKTSYHLFQPLLYQVATGILSEGEIAPATREVLKRQKNTRVLLGEVTDIDVELRTVTSQLLDRTTVTPYDELVVAAGAGQSYFGNDQFARHAPGMKSIDDALELRGRIFGAFELAELATDADEVDRLLTFVVIGAGPTGVEMAGQISELARRALVGDFRNIDPRTARVVLVDFAPEVLGSFGDHLSASAQRRLKQIGVEVQLGKKVVGVDRDGVTVEDEHGSRSLIPSFCKIWAAGVSASPLGRRLAEQTGAEVDRAGRIATRDDTSLPGHPEVFVVGDMASLNHYPGVAQVAIQGARHAARIIEGEERTPFVYKDKGSMATVSRFHAVASVKGLRFSGFIAWLLWLAVHIVYIVGFKNRVTTVMHWFVSFLGRGRSERVATEQQVLARLALEQVGDSFSLGSEAQIQERTSRTAKVR